MLIDTTSCIEATTSSTDSLRCCQLSPPRSGADQDRSMAADQPHHRPETPPPTVATQLGDLPEACLAQAIALTSPRDACVCAAVSPAFRAAADSDHVWRSFLPGCLVLPPTDACAGSSSKKEAYLGLCDARNAVTAAAGADGCRVWLERPTGARCCAVPARRLSLPWDDGEFSWRWTPHPSSRFGEVAELLHCTSLDIYARLPCAALTPATPYAAYLVYGAAAEDGLQDQGQGRRGLSYPDQETAVAVGGRVLDRRTVCLFPDEAEARKFGGGSAAVIAGVVVAQPPRARADGWWEVEMGRLCAVDREDGEEGEDDVVASFEVLGWYPKRGLVLESVEFRPLPTSLPAIALSS